MARPTPRLHDSVVRLAQPMAKGNTMRAKDVMSTEVMSIAANATALEATELLVNARVSAMPVLDDDGVMIGIVTEADLLSLVEDVENSRDPGLQSQPVDGVSSKATFNNAYSRPVVDVMTKTVVTADENA